MIRRCLYLAGLLLLLSGTSLPADEPHEATLVLVSGAGLGDSQLTPNQLRRIFLGMPVSANGKAISALRNTSDPLLNEIFLQKVVYMSERRYQRLLVSKTFRTGQIRPPNFKSHDNLVQALKTVPDSVSVMWERDAKNHTDLHVIQVLWTGRPQ